MKENVFFFIEATRVYGVSRDKLFTEDDLCKERNIPKVIECLEALSERARVKGFRFAFVLLIFYCFFNFLLFFFLLCSSF
jgi:hypothetical protein